MSSRMISKKFESTIIQEIPKEGPINFGNITIPFSEFGGSKKISDIYEGSEKIPFRERDQAYQTIIENEFTEELKRFLESLKTPQF